MTQIDEPSLDEQIDKILDNCIVGAMGKGFMYDEHKLKQELKTLIATQIQEARIDELKRWEAPENEIMMTFADPCNICGFNYKTLRQAQQDRLKELRGE